MPKVNKDQVTLNAVNKQIYLSQENILNVLEAQVDDGGHFCDVNADILSNIRKMLVVSQSDATDDVKITNIIAIEKEFLADYSEPANNWCRR